MRLLNKTFLFIVALIVMLTSSQLAYASQSTDVAISNMSIDQLKSYFYNKYGSEIPKQWGENVDGVVTRISTQEKVIALTFDACGSVGTGKGYDKDLIDFLIKENIPATLFLNSRWIDANYDITLELENGCRSAK